MKLFYKIVIPFIFILAGFKMTMAQVNMIKLISNISDSLNRHYIFPEKAIEIGGYLQSRQTGKAYRLLENEPLKLAAQIQKDLNAVHRDPHLRISFDLSFQGQQQMSPDSLQALMIKTYWKDHNYAFNKVEVLPGNIGYLTFNLFVDGLSAAKSTVFSAIRFLANTHALIIDLRENIGGDPAMVSLLESFFFTERTHMNDLINRTTGDTTRMYADPVKVDSLFMGMPVYILTSKHTFSGAEDFSYAMQKAGRATIVGETTGGGAHPQRPFSVGQGFVLSIPYARSLNPVTKTDWEGTGVLPDNPVKASDALNRALALVFKRASDSARTLQEKNKYLYYTRTLLHDTRVSALLPYTGKYGDLEIYQRHNRLYCKNNNNSRVTLLQQLTNGLFILDGEAQVEFIKDSHGKCTSIKIYVNDGTVFEEKRKTN